MRFDQNFEQWPQGVDRGITSVFALASIVHVRAKPYRYVDESVIARDMFIWYKDRVKVFPCFPCSANCLPWLFYLWWKWTGTCKSVYIPSVILLICASGFSLGRPTFRKESETGKIVVYRYIYLYVFVPLFGIIWKVRENLQISKIINK